MVAEGRGRFAQQHDAEHGEASGAVYEMPRDLKWSTLNKMSAAKPAAAVFG